MLAGARYADADTHVRRQAIQRVHGGRDREADLLRDTCRAGRIRDSEQQDDELVATDSRCDVASSNRDLQPLRNRPENLIPCDVPQLIVDRLEVIEIAVEHRNLVTRQASLDGRIRQQVKQPSTVGQTSQLIEIGKIAELIAFGSPALDAVGEVISDLLLPHGIVDARQQLRGHERFGDEIRCAMF